MRERKSHKTSGLIPSGWDVAVSAMDRSGTPCARHRFIARLQPSRPSRSIRLPAPRSWAVAVGPSLPFVPSSTEGELASSVPLGPHVGQGRRGRSVHLDLTDGRERVLWGGACGCAAPSALRHGYVASPGYTATPRLGWSCGAVAVQSTAYPGGPERFPSGPVSL